MSRIRAVKEDNSQTTILDFVPKKVDPVIDKLLKEKEEIEKEFSDRINTLSKTTGSSPIDKTLELMERLKQIKKELSELR